MPFFQKEIRTLAPPAYYRPIVGLMNSKIQVALDSLLQKFNKSPARHQAGLYFHQEAYPRRSHRSILTSKKEVPIIL